MQADNLQQHLDYVSSQGLVLSPEHKAALQVSLELVRRNYKFHQVYFWGKVLGLSADYFIIQGVDRDELKSRKTLYSFNCMDWKLLPPATDEMIVRSMLIKGRFMGDPSHEYEKTVVKKVNEEQTDQDIEVKEEERLTSTIELINREAAIIPRGAFIMTPRDEVHMNRSFEGLSATEAGKLRSYLHFTKPSELKKKSLLLQANLEESIDFLNSLEDDELKVFWTLQYERGNKLVILQNLLWPGFTFFHVPETTQFGYLYMGLGEKNMDFPFMI
ncbi:radial spoke head protein 9 homolog isoform X2 [Hypanus sabinus]|uniref:radial spoke head protein 9 homolog isoform X2 n=1 Tax=Hypanus sabinus TaxID=79690 RepID=UPI0028C4A496|nr:radial spoke head protein 9 homolog isoform X2 [Hypanus sabinus]